MIEMNPEIRSQWTSALRSGEFEQGRDYLATVNQDGSVNYCCLGVLCELASEAGVVERLPDYLRTYSRVVPYGEREQVFALPQVVKEWAGISEEVSKDGIQHLIGLNDQGVVFDKIADVIEGVDKPKPV